MVTPMFTVFQTMTGFHGGLRRCAAAGALGVMLVLSAGIPAANAAGPAPQDTCFLLFCSPSPPKTAEPTPTQPAPGPGPSEAPGTPSNPPATPAPAVPSVPSDPGPADETVAPSDAPSPSPSDAADSTADGGDSGASSTESNSVTGGSGSNTQQVQATSGVGSAGQGLAPGSGAQDKGSQATSSRHLEPASLVNQGDGNPASVWWGIGLLVVAGFALVVFFRLRRTEKLLTVSA